MFRNPGLQALTDASTAHRQCARDNEALTSDEGTADYAYNMPESCMCHSMAYMCGTSKQKIMLTMDPQMQHTGVAKTVFLMDWRKSRESTKCATVATRPPLRWLVTCSQQHEEASILNHIRSSTPSS